MIRKVIIISTEFRGNEVTATIGDLSSVDRTAAEGHDEIKEAE